MAKIKVTDNTSRRETIVQTAAKLFKEKGFKAASMRELATVLGIEAASLYNHIKSKDELLNEICFSVAKRYTAHMDQVEADQSPIIHKVERLLRYHVQEMVNNYEEVYVTDNDWRMMNEPGLSEYRTMRRDYRKRFTAIVQEGIDKEEIKALDANSAVMIFINAIAAVDQWHRIVHKVSSQQLEENLVAILLGGIRK